MRWLAPLHEGGRAHSRCWEKNWTGRRTGAMSETRRGGYPKSSSSSGSRGGGHSSDGGR